MCTCQLLAMYDAIMKVRNGAEMERRERGGERDGERGVRVAGGAS